MELKFDVKMTTGVIYDYLLKHTYSSPPGLLGGILGALFLVMSVIKGNYLYLAAGLFLLAYLPVSLYLGAARQMKTTPAFQEKLTYLLNEEGITVFQGGQSQLQPWENIYKAVSSNKSIIVYHTKVNAWIFPRKDMGEKAAKAVEMISTHVSPGKVNIRW